MFDEEVEKKEEVGEKKKKEIDDVQ